MSGRYLVNICVKVMLVYLFGALPGSDESQGLYRMPGCCFICDR